MEETVYQRYAREMRAVANGRWFTAAAMAKRLVVTPTTISKYLGMLMYDGQVEEHELLGLKTSKMWRFKSE